MSRKIIRFTYIPGDPSFLSPAPLQKTLRLQMAFLVLDIFIIVIPKKLCRIPPPRTKISYLHKSRIFWGALPQLHS